MSTEPEVNEHMFNTWMALSAIPGITWHTTHNNITCDPVNPQLWACQGQALNHQPHIFRVLKIKNIRDKN